MAEVTDLPTKSTENLVSHLAKNVEDTVQLVFRGHILDKG